MLATLLLVGAISQWATTSAGHECYDYDLFGDVLAKGGAVLRSTIETPGSPTIKRLMVVEYQGTREVFGGLDDCVIVPALYIDYPDDMKPVPVLPLLPPKKPADPNA